MKRTLGLFATVTCLSIFVLPVACGDDDAAPSNTSSSSSGGLADGGGEGGVLSGTNFDAPAVPCTDDDAAIYGDPGAVPTGDADRGKILKCSKGADVSKDELQAQLTKVGYAGKAAASGAKVYKVTFATTRGDDKHSPGYSSAIVYAPTTPRAAKLPIVVAARGSRGQAARCAVSKLEPTVGVNDDAYRLNYSLVANGYAVIVPDLAGYANFGAAGNPPSAYASSEDVGRSTLDASRALKLLFPSLDDKTVIVGHSQGGHSALSALALSATYGAQGTIAGVAVYAPLWFSQRTWAAIVNDNVALGQGYTIEKQETASAVSVYYNYTHAELLDGPGEGIKIFKPAYQAAMKKYVEESCWGENQGLKDTKVAYAYELYDATFAQKVGFGGLDPCNADDALCVKWQKRYYGDRPHLTGAAATTPILLMYGGKDETIPGGRMKCGVERLQEDKTALSVCFEPDATHNTIINTRGDYAADWIASLTLGGAAPAACAANETAITDACPGIPPND